jgi:hypothetical protein
MIHGRKSIKTYTHIHTHIHTYTQTHIHTYIHTHTQTYKYEDRVTKGRKVPCWTGELTILKKRTLVLRRRYHRTKNDDNLRHERTLRYQEGKRLSGKTPGGKT